MDVNASSSSNRLLVVHAGFPKTGTTAIQSYLADNYAMLNSAGIGVLSQQATGHHFALGQHLLSLDGRHLQNGYASDLKTEAMYPVWAENHYKYIISDEELINIGPNGVRAIKNYAEQNGARCHGVIVLRTPSEWIYSLWTQATKINASTDWINWLNLALEKKIGFISSALSVWHETETVQVSLIEYSPKNMVSIFCNELDIPYDRAKLKIQNRSILNVTPPVVEVICGAAFNDMVSASVQRHGSSLLPGEVQRILLDLADNSKPAFELARAVEERMSRDAVMEDSILGYESFGALSAYLKNWAEDAEAYLQLNRTRFDERSIAVIQPLIIGAIETSMRLIKDPQECGKLPQRNATLKIPVDAAFISMVRVASHLITKM
jgi:hypothetical protein